MKRLTFLVLTDHSGHSDQNSLYALVNTLFADHRCARVDLASRGNPHNEAFFAGDGARVRGFTVNETVHFDPEAKHFNTADTLPELTAYDVVWLRLPHPIPEDFFPKLRALVSGSQTLIVNDPSGIEATSTKAFLTQFPDWTPPTRIVETEREARDFARRHPIVLKPLRAYGGQGILRMNHPEESLSVFEGPYLAMKFLKNVSQGDKRILVVNGKILAASLRIPPPGEWLCNVARGGTSVGAEVSPEEEDMVTALAPELLSRGICFAGIDTLVNDGGQRVLSEINTLSIGGFPQAEVQTGRPILRQAIDELLNYCYDRR
ncbi:glutathione synthase [Neolewinella xylanilytica]|uniref:Glutathione synthase n=1 Tax=Neolewinella xylanilytica TaxID=1514080 RepID=A0A2S6I2M0_9BACT|nr:glutathione synthetase [Neolewinella xylanilytica]PPK85432.1 glutathione synthase [Neolewinella xylanilytica]